MGRRSLLQSLASRRTARQSPKKTTRSQAIADQQRALRACIDSIRGTSYYGERIAELHELGQWPYLFPLQTYDDIAVQVEQMGSGTANILTNLPVIAYARSSGSTGHFKYIPITQECLDVNHFQAGSDMMKHYLATHPDTQLLLGKSLVFGGALDEDRSQWQVGYISAVLQSTAPRRSSAFKLPSDATQGIPDRQTKKKAIAKEIATEEVVAFAGVPLRMVDFLEGLTPTQLKRLKSVEAVFTGWCRSAPYESRLRHFLPSAELREVYNSSEAFIGAQAYPGSPVLQLFMDHGVFYEFRPLDSQTDTLTIAEVEPDVQYALIITTLAGLIRYELGDTIRFVDVEQGTFVITGRTKEYLDVFNDHTTVEHVDAALQEVTRQTGLQIREYTMGPDSEVDPSRYEIVIEAGASGASVSLKRLEEVFDKGLCAANPHLAFKRDSHAIDAPRIRLVPHGFFQDWLKRQWKLGNQHKVPRCRPDRSVLDSLQLPMAKKKSTKNPAKK